MAPVRLWHHSARGSRCRRYQAPLACGDCAGDETCLMLLSDKWSEIELLLLAIIKFSKASFYRCAWIQRVLIQLVNISSRVCQIWEQKVQLVMVGMLCDLVTLLRHNFA